MATVQPIACSVCVVIVLLCKLLVCRYFTVWLHEHPFKYRTLNSYHIKTLELHRPHHDNCFNYFV